MSKEQNDLIDWRARGEPMQKPEGLNKRVFQPNERVLVDDRFPGKVIGVTRGVLDSYIVVIEDPSVLDPWSAVTRLSSDLKKISEKLGFFEAHANSKSVPAVVSSYDKVSSQGVAQTEDSYEVPFHGSMFDPAHPQSRPSAGVRVQLLLDTERTGILAVKEVRDENPNVDVIPTVKP